MDAKTRRMLLRDAGVVTSVVLLGLVGLSAITGTALDEAGEILPLDDLHAAIGYAMAITAGIHALLHLGALRSYVGRRIRDLASRGGSTPRTEPEKGTVGASDTRAVRS